MADHIRAFVSYGGRDPRSASRAASFQLATSSRTFTVFPNLPLEIRRIIWGFSLPGPRNIEVFMNGKRLLVHKSSHTVLFTVMRACKEAEEVVLGRYEKVKAEAWSLTGLPRHSIVLFNNKQDIVRLSGLKAPVEFLSFASEDILGKMTSIGVDRSCFMPAMASCVSSGRSALLHAYLFQMPNLKKIVIFADRGVPRDDRTACGRAWVRRTKGKILQLVGGDHLLRYLADIEIELGSCARQ